MRFGSERPESHGRRALPFRPDDEAVRVPSERPERRAAGIIQAAWRRKLVLILPLLLMLPISFAAAMLLPQKYVARTLILFQDSDPENPLISRSLQVSERMQDRIAGMRALLKSENVLSKVVSELAGGVELHPIERANRIRSLQLALELDNVGNNLLEFRLAGTAAKGLGNELDIVLNHFLDRYRNASPHQTPERVVTIDRPSDPTRPVRSKVVVFAGGVIAGLLIGIALAMLLEFLDTRLRLPWEFERATGLPVVARLPPVRRPREGG